MTKNNSKKILDQYEEVDDFSALPQEKIGAVCAFCYYDGKFVIVKNEGLWQPVAGQVEKGESAEIALKRETQEESNMKVIQSYPLSYFYIPEGDYYSAWYLCEVIPFGPFISDPDQGKVSEIKLVDFNDISKYVAKDDIAIQVLDRCKIVLEKILLDKKT